MQLQKEEMLFETIQTDDQYQGRYVFKLLQAADDEVMMDRGTRESGTVVKPSTFVLPGFSGIGLNPTHDVFREWLDTPNVLWVGTGDHPVYYTSGPRWNRVTDVAHDSIFALGNLKRKRRTDCLETTSGWTKSASIP